MGRQQTRSPRGETPEERRQRVQKVIQILDRTYSGVALALNFKTPLELLIALILAAQCTDERVNQVTAPLFKKYRAAHNWAGADLVTLEAEIRPTGFYRNKAKAIRACCQMLCDRFDGKVPQGLEDLVSLPGVGRKTANILRGNAFDEPAIGVDTHVARLAQRLGLTPQTDPDKIEFDLNPLVPDKVKVRFCHLLQAHGRAICLARKPKCSACPIHHTCPYPARAGIPILPRG
ncbi:MAG: endonuclease III [Candidatus Methylomirabilales bacterium]